MTATLPAPETREGDPMSLDPEPAAAHGSPRDRLIALLAGYLVGCPRFRWPGADGLTVADVVRVRYPAAAAAGLVPALDELAERHPDLAGVIAELFPGPRPT